MDDDFLTDGEKQILPVSVRITFPVRDLPTTALKDMAELARKLMWVCEEMYRQRDRAERTKRMEFGFALEDLRNSVKRLARLHDVVISEGRPRATATAEHDKNRWATVSDCEGRYPQQVDRDSGP